MDKYLAELLADLKEIGEWLLFEDWGWIAIKHLEVAGLVEIEKFSVPYIVPEPNGFSTEFTFKAKAI